MSLHHKHGPSSLKSKAQCAGWINDETSDTTFADAGELLHKATETGDLTGLPPEEIGWVNMCLGVCAKFAKTHTEHKEIKLQVLGGLSFGTSDRVFVNAEEIIVLDFKFAWHYQGDAETNLQGWSYLLGAAEKFPGRKKMRVMFLYPKLDTITQAHFTPADFPRMELAVRTIIGRAEEYEKTRSDALLNPSVEACIYCGRKTTCPRVLEFAVVTAKRYEPLQVIEDVHSSEITDPVKMGRLLAAVSVLERFCESVKHHSKQLALELGGLRDANGEVIYEIASREAPRKLDKSKLCDAVDILRRHGITDGELLSVSDISIVQATKLLSDRAPKGKKKATLGALETELYDANVYLQGEPTVTLKAVRKNN